MAKKGKFKVYFRVQGAKVGAYNTIVRGGRGEGITVASTT
jgi:hypothetical protein